MDWQRLLLAPRGAWNRYGVAALLACGSLLPLHLLPWWSADAFSSLALFTVVLSALYGGLGPALLDTAITAIGIDYFFAPPIHQVFDSWASALRVAVFAAVGFLVADVVASLREAYRRLQEQQLQTEQAKQAREDILAIVSHDLRSPLSSMLLCAQHVKSAAGRAPGPQLAEAAERMLRAGGHMARLIEDLLDAVRMEKGQLRLEPAPHDLLRLAEEALEGVRAAAQSRQVLVRRAAAPGDYRLHCDGGRVTQALGNLLANAVKFSPPGGLVDVELESSDAELLLRVRDRGPGIAPADLPRLFERYWRPKGGTKEGTGLGLFIAKSIVDAHGGRIEVASLPGEETDFTIALPRDTVGRLGASALQS